MSLAPSPKNSRFDKMLKKDGTDVKARKGVNGTFSFRVFFCFKELCSYFSQEELEATEPLFSLALLLTELVPEICVSLNKVRNL